MIFPCALTTWPDAAIATFSASMNGVRCATAFFITRADLTTWGRNIFPAPKRSPTTPMPSINGPSITSSGRPSFTRIDLDIGVDPLDQRVRKPLFDRAVAPLFGLLFRDGFANVFERFSEL